MALGWRARWRASGLFFIAAMGIVIIHASLGWRRTALATSGAVVEWHVTDAPQAAVSDPHNPRRSR